MFVFVCAPRLLAHLVQPGHLLLLHLSFRPPLATKLPCHDIVTRHANFNGNCNCPTTVAELARRFTLDLPASSNRVRFSAMGNGQSK